MKKIIVLMICVLALAIVFACCGSRKTGTTGTSDTAAASEQTGSSDASGASGESGADESAGYADGYIPPESAIEIDISEDDPSTDDVTFVYNPDGRVAQCYYKLDGDDVYVNYTYDDENNRAQIFAFKGAGMLVDNKTIELPGAYDSDAGFSLIDGYYFKGYEK